MVQELKKQNTGSGLPSQDTSHNSPPLIPPYKGEWSKKQVFHLIRRCMFGVTQADFEFFSKLTLDECLDVLLKASPAPTPPLNAYNDAQYTDPYVPFGETWAFCPYTDKGIADKKRISSMRGWWIGLLLNQDRSITEKMTLFWHNHVPVEIGRTYDVRSFYGYIAPLRANSLGNFKKLMYDITTCVGMLQYLCTTESNAEAPNENYSREFQELFTIGKGPGSHYTQDDVVAAARILTGWSQDEIGTGTMFKPDWHDTADKQFSPFYNNTIIKGRKGQAGAIEARELVDMVFAKDEVARHTCRSIYRWFVQPVINEQAEAEVIIPLAAIFVENNYEIVPVLRALLSSEHFFDSAHIGCQIKNPIDHLIGICRSMGVTSFDNDLSKQYAAWESIFLALAGMSMAPGQPPSVAGWPAYYLSPSYDKLWINSNTLSARLSTTDEMLTPVGMVRGEHGVRTHLDMLSFTSRCTAPDDMDRLIADSTSFLSPVTFDTDQISALKEILSDGRHTWKDTWQQYASNPNDTEKREAATERLQKYYTYLLRQMECHLG